MVDGASSQTRVLVADAQAEDRASIADALRAEGCVVEEVEDTTRAWAMLQSRRYDLVVLEARLPAVNGLELLRQMRKLSPFPAVVIVFDQPSPAMENLAHSLGAAFCDRKPVNLRRLRRLVRASRRKQSR
ncbi:MAG: response regulator [Armatimonadota bacterium]